jgi:phosphatidylserine/phosphatidylglycerophosphate/cardiolipin synthase-like enzyme
MRHILQVLTALLLLAGCGAPSQAPRLTSTATLSSSSGGILRLWQDADIFSVVHRLLDGTGPGETLWVEMYEFDRPDLMTSLRQARDRGADVRLIVDRTVSVSARTADTLLGQGLAVRAYPVDDRRHQIDHVKLVLAGGEALVGGMNWGRSSARNHDYAFETTAPGVLGRLRDIFQQDWSLAGGRVAPLAAVAGTVSQTTPGQEIRARLVSELAAAHESVDAEVFVLTDADVIAALSAAHRRGVRVRMLLDPNQDVNKPGFNLLRTSGVEVRWYPVPQGAKLHAKAALFDRRELLLGSANWSLSGLSVNHELDLLSDDGQATTAFASRFETDWSTSG